MIERLLAIYRAMEMELTKLVQEDEEDPRYTAWVERERVRDRIDELEKSILN